MAPTVVSASLGVLGPLVVKLAGLLAGEYGRLKGVRKEILALNLELSSMHAAVQKYAMLPDPDIQVKQWISMVRELAYDIEDFIDKYIHRLGNGGRHGGFKESFRRIAHSLKTLKARHGIASQIEELKSRIEHVKELKNSYMLDDPACRTSNDAVVDPRLSALFVEEKHLVGTEGPRDDLVQWMMKDASISCKVLSIVGFGGLGKTTLANQVYRKIQGHFHCGAFVSISQKPDTNKIIKDLIKKLPSPVGFTQDIDIWDQVTSIAKLRELLEDKRYLVIIDDIWSTPAWDVIKWAFPENNYGSRIIITTRIVDVASSCCPGGDDRIYRMQPLSDVHAQRLFFKRIFSNEGSCPDMLKEVSEKILKKCGGLPLAIISIASLLADRPVVKEEWEKIKRSIGSGLLTNASLEGMSSILSLSYNYLHPNLKTCLLYLSAFPEDHVIKREMIMRQWIAEGFIPEERGQSQQDVAEHYFNELINKSMVLPVDIWRDGKAYACRLHDMMLEILISKSAEDNFITIVGSGQVSLENRPGFIRRLSIQEINQELASALAKEDLTHVRSLIITASSDGSGLLPSLDKFEALRVLEFAQSSDLHEYIMKGLDKLFTLKYLSYWGSRISKLPPGIVMLRDLETLDLPCTAVKELPVGFDQLTKLEYLAIRAVKIPSGIGNMVNLRVISSFNIIQSQADTVEDLGNLTNLNSLCVQFGRETSEEYKTHEHVFRSSMCKLGNCKLQDLTIHGSLSLDFLDSWSPLPSSLQTFTLTDNSYFTTIPKWIAPDLTNLSSLHLDLIQLSLEGLHTLGKLSALLNLSLWLRTGMGDRLIVQGIGFPSLNMFHTTGCNGPNFTFMKGAMPKLKLLHLSVNASVAKTYGFCSGIEHLRCLQKLHVNVMQPSEDTPAAAAIRKEASAELRREVAANPNNPTIILAGFHIN